MCQYVIYIATIPTAFLGSRLLTPKEIEELPTSVAPSDHYIVKDFDHGFMCQKCGEFGDLEVLRGLPCEWRAMAKLMAEKVSPEPEPTPSDPPFAESAPTRCEAKAEHGLLQQLQDEELAVALMQEEMDLLESMLALETLEKEEQSLEEAMLQSAMMAMDERPPCKVIRPTDPAALADMQSLHEQGFSKENAVWAVKVSATAGEARVRATNRAQAESTLEKRSEKPKQAKKKDENPFNGPPDANQKRLDDLPCVKITPRTSTPLISSLAYMFLVLLDWH